MPYILREDVFLLVYFLKKTKNFQTIQYNVDALVVPPMSSDTPHYTVYVDALVVPPCPRALRITPYM